LCFKQISTQEIIYLKREFGRERERERERERDKENPIGIWLLSGRKEDLYISIPPEDKHSI
jgi:hypothetical protein